MHEETPPHDPSPAVRSGEDSARMWMKHALQLARQGEGFVEPNPMVGCVLVRDGRLIGEGAHRRYGGPHAEVAALSDASARDEDPRGATAFVTLEPCCHHGQTPPCTEALLGAGVSRVVAAMRDPFPRVDGGGFKQLREAGVEVESGLLELEARELNAPYLRRVIDGRPWVIAKWAMSLDGKIATAGGESQWISGEASRAETHRLRGRVDAIIVGYQTVRADDPLLTARPAGARVATRVVCDSQARIPLASRLCQTATETPTIIACGPKEAIASSRLVALEETGCQILYGPADREQRIAELLRHLSHQGATNVMVEGGAELLGSFYAQRLIDEAHVYIAPKLLGGGSAPTPIGGEGVSQLSDALQLPIQRIDRFDDDVRVIVRAAV